MLLQILDLGSGCWDPPLPPTSLVALPSLRRLVLPKGALLAAAGGADEGGAESAAAQVRRRAEAGTLTVTEM